MKKDCMDIIQELAKAEQAKVDAIAAAKDEEKAKQQRAQDKVDAESRRILAPIADIVSRVAAQYPESFKDFKVMRDGGRDRGEFIVLIRDRTDSRRYWYQLRFFVVKDGDEKGRIAMNYTAMTKPIFSAATWADLQPYLMQLLACIIADSELPDPALWRGVKSYSHVMDLAWSREKKES